MKKYNNLYLENNSVLEDYNKLIEYINNNDEFITCAPYNRTLNYILSNKTFDTQLEVMITHQKEGRNTIDTFEDFINESDDIKEISNNIKKEYDCENFQKSLINDVFNYFETNVEENQNEEEDED